MEIVTEPEIRTAEQARRYAEELQLLLRSIGASDADMERGQMRVEANVSLRPRGTEPFGTRVEVKNMNSFRAVERAIAFEIERQAAALDAGEALVQETRGWSEERGETYLMRVKETPTTTATSPSPTCRRSTSTRPGWPRSRAALPELPAARRARYRDDAGAERRTTRRCSSPTPMPAALFEATMAAAPALEPKPVANWVTGEYLRLRNAATPDAGDGRRRRSSAASSRPVAERAISRAQGREVLEAHAATGRVRGRRSWPTAGFRQISDQRRAGRGRRRGPRGQPGGGRGLPRRARRRRSASSSARS